jgi:hypothetical protein
VASGSGIIRRGAALLDKGSAAGRARPPSDDSQAELASLRAEIDAMEKAKAAKLSRLAELEGTKVKEEPDRKKVKRESGGGQGSSAVKKKKKIETITIDSDSD